MGRFRIEMPWEFVEGMPITLRVSGYKAPFRPARTNCANEDARPAEGGEVEDLEIAAVKRGLYRPVTVIPLSEMAQDDLRDDDDFVRAVEEATS